MLTINQDSYVPPYAQLKSNLVERIRRAEYRPGDRIPSIRDLAGGTGLAYQTVSKAIAELIEEGVLVTKRGTGTFVARIGEPADIDALAAPTTLNI